MATGGRARKGRQVSQLETEMCSQLLVCAGIIGGGGTAGDNSMMSSTAAPKALLGYFHSSKLQTLGFGKEVWDKQAGSRAGVY